jgi:hypothetical protein
MSKYTLSCRATARNNVKNKRAIGYALVLLIACICMLPIAAHAQVLYGDLTGNVTDQTGALVAGASVQLLNDGTGAVSTTKSDDHGIFEFTDLEPGVYKLTITATGLGTAVQDGLRVEANNVLRANTVLTVAGKTETVTVAATAPVLQTDRGDIHTDLNTSEIGNLPLNSSEGRNFSILYKIVPGTSMPQEPNSAAGNPQRGMTTFVNGASAQTNTTRVDGQTDMYPWLPANVAYSPPPDSIETVNVVTNSFDAEQGMAGGAAINITIKSGTNQFHGGAFFSHNDQHMTALNYFTQPNEYGSNCVVSVSLNKCGPLRKNINNQYAGNIGGPILKNKLFFFGDWERDTQRQNAFLNQEVVDPSMYTITTVGGVQGIQLPTSYVSGTTTVPVTIYNPMTGATNGTGRTQFTNNFIPLTQISPAALGYLQNYLGKAVTTFAPYSPANSFNYTNNADGDYTRSDIDAKFTYLPNSKSTVWGRYSISLADILDPPALGTAGGNATNGGQQGNALSRIQVLGLGGTYAFSPSVIMDGNFGYTRQKLGALNLDDPTSGGQNFGIILGIPGANGGTYLQNGFPAFSLGSNFANMGDPNTANPFLFRDNQYTGDINLSWQKNTHAIRFGFEEIHWGLNHFQPEGGNVQTGRGGFGFNGNMTSDGTPTGITAYNNFADFLLGLPDQSGKASDTLVPNTERESVYSWYVRDQWQATSKLTVSYGARVEWYPFMTEANYEGNPEGIPVFNPATGQVIVGGNGGVPVRDGVKTPPQIVPRLGLAYRLTPKTVVRAGVGFSVDPSNFRNLRDAYPSDALVQDNAPSTYYPAGVMGIPATGSGITCTGVTNTSTCTYGPFTNLPLGVAALPTFNISSGSIPLPNVNTTTVPLNYRRGYIESYNLTVQRELGAGFNFQIAYVRTLAIREQGYFNLNWSNPGAGTAGQMNLAFPTQLTQNGLTINSQCPCAGTNYNGMQTQLSRKLGHGGFIGINYTWSHAIDQLNNANTNYADAGFFFTAPNYFYRNYATSGYDQTNNLQIFGVEQSPFGKDGRWMQHGFAGKVLGGWQLNEVLSKYSGFPFTVSGNANTLNSTGNSQTANLLVPTVQFYNNPGPVPGTTCTNSNPACTYFNPADFFSVVACTATGAVPGWCGASFGNAGRDEFRGPGLFNLDMSLGRTFPIHEQMNLMLQIQAFSLTNTPHFNNPSATASTTVGNPGSFGQITSTEAASGSNTSSLGSGARDVWVTAKFTF